MPGMDFLGASITVLAAAVLGVALFQRLGLGPVLGYLAAGAVIGSAGLDIALDHEAIRRLAEFGVVFLLFAVGLELPLERVRVMPIGILWLGLAQIGVTAVIIALLAWSIGNQPATAVVIGLALTLSSTALVLRLLSDSAELNSRFGRAAFGVLVMQDLAVGPMLVVALSLGPGATEESLALALALSVVKAVGLTAAVFVIGRILTQPVFRAVAATHTPEILAALTLLIVALAAMASERAGLSLAFGALLAGMMLASSPYRLQVAAEVGPFRGLLLGLFFMSVGMALDVQVLRQYFGAILAVSFALMAGKSLVTGALAWALHFPPGQAVRFGLLLSQGGEFAFVLFGVGARDQIIPEPHVQVLSAAVIVSMMATPLIALAGRRLERAIAGRGTSAVPQMAADAEQISDHVIIAGYGRIGRAVSRQLGEQGISWIAIDSDAGIVLEAQAKDLPVYYGDAWHLDVMVALHVERARSVVVTVNNPPAALQLVAALHYAIPGMTIIARAYDEAHAEELRHAGATAVIPEAAPVGSRLAALATASPG